MCEDVQSAEQRGPRIVASWVDRPPAAHRLCYPLCEENNGNLVSMKNSNMLIIDARWPVICCFSATSQCDLALQHVSRQRPMGTAWPLRSQWPSTRPIEQCLEMLSEGW